MDNEVRVRFAPSPTGPFHIGGARSALFNWLVARKSGGKLILRIEDTDLERSSKESEENIKSAIKWLGLDWDEGIDVGGDYGPYRQTERLAFYRKYTDQLLAEGKAYYCYCTDEELEAERAALLAQNKMPRYLGKCRNLTADERQEFVRQGRKPTVRFKVPPGEQIVIDDLVRGRVVFDSDGIGDFVIVKSDGIPTYNYAVVVDDALMKITHVIRAEEHLSNTPRQCLLFEALGFERPKFGHISLILGKDRTKMSKRHGATSVEQYKELGYCPEAIVNFLALLGWSPQGEKEIFSVEELIEAFSLEHVAKNPAVFEVDKLNWINHQYIQKMDDEEFLALAEPQMVKAGYMTGRETAAEKEWLRKVIFTAKAHVSFGAQIPECVKLYFADDFTFEDEEAAAVLRETSVPEVVRLFLAKLAAAEDLEALTLKSIFKAVQKESGLGGKAVFMPIRVALTGNQHGPELVEIISLLGKDRVQERILASLDKIGVAVN